MKRILSILVCMAMLLGMIIVPAAAADMPTVTVEKVTEAVNPGDDVTLEVTIAGNPGFTNFEWYIDFDDTRLDLKTVVIDRYSEDLEDYVNYINGALVEANPEYAADRGFITAAKTTPFTKNAILFKLTFEVLADAPAAVTV